MGVDVLSLATRGWGRGAEETMKSTMSDSCFVALAKNACDFCEFRACVCKFPR